MADQVLRPLAELALWSELSTLAQLWQTFLPLVDSLPCWVSASTLLLVLQRAASFQMQTARAGPQVPSSGQPSARPPAATTVATARLSGIYRRVCAQLPPLMPAVVSLVDLATSDKVSVIGLQLLVLLHARFQPTLVASLSPAQRAAHIDSVLSLLLCIFLDAHPDEPQPDRAEGKKGEKGAVAAGGGAARGSATNGSPPAAATCADTPARRLSASPVSPPPGRRSVEHALLVERSVLMAIRPELPALASTLQPAHRDRLMAWLTAQLRVSLRSAAEPQGARPLPGAHAPSGMNRALPPEQLAASAVPLLDALSGCLAPRAPAGSAPAAGAPAPPPSGRTSSSPAGATPSRRLFAAESGSPVATAAPAAPAVPAVPDAPPPLTVRRRTFT
jgi:hypothetical protein